MLINSGFCKYVSNPLINIARNMAENHEMIYSLSSPRLINSLSFRIRIIIPNAASRIITIAFKTDE